MKRTKQCPKCSSLRIGHVATQIDANDVVVKPEKDLAPLAPFVSSHTRDPVAPRMVGVSTQVAETGYFRYSDVSPLLGALEAYVCTDCGYYESYVKDPQAVGWANIVGFSWVNEPPQSDGAYR